MAIQLYSYLHDALDLVAHTSTIEAFYHQFQAIKSLLATSQPEIPEAYFATRFIYGLLPEFQKFIIKFNPSTVTAAYRLALIYEESIYLHYFPEIYMRIDEGSTKNHKEETNQSILGIDSICEGALAEEFSSEFITAVNSTCPDQREEGTVDIHVGSLVLYDPDTSDLLAVAADQHMDIISSDVVSQHRVPFYEVMHISSLVEDVQLPVVNGVREDDEPIGQSLALEDTYKQELTMLLVKELKVHPPDLANILYVDYFPDIPLTVAVISGGNAVGNQPELVPTVDRVSAKSMSPLGCLVTYMPIADHHSCSSNNAKPLVSSADTMNLELGSSFGWRQGSKLAYTHTGYSLPVLPQLIVPRGADDFAYEGAYILLPWLSSFVLDPSGQAPYCIIIGATSSSDKFSFSKMFVTAMKYVDYNDEEQQPSSMILIPLRVIAAVFLRSTIKIVVLEYSIVSKHHAAKDPLVFAMRIIYLDTTTTYIHQGEENIIVIVALAGFIVSKVFNTPMAKEIVADPGKQVVNIAGSAIETVTAECRAFITWNFHGCYVGSECIAVGQQQNDRARSKAMWVRNSDSFVELVARMTNYNYQGSSKGLLVSSIMIYTLPGDSASSMNFPKHADQFAVQFNLCLFRLDVTFMKLQIIPSPFIESTLSHIDFNPQQDFNLIADPRLSTLHCRKERGNVASKHVLYCFNIF